jgi:hypothetical protein
VLSLGRCSSSQQWFFYGSGIVVVWLWLQLGKRPLSRKKTFLLLQRPSSSGRTPLRSRAHRPHRNLTLEVHPDLMQQMALKKLDSAHALYTLIHSKIKTLYRPLEQRVLMSSPLHLSLVTNPLLRPLRLHQWLHPTGPHAQTVPLISTLILITSMSLTSLSDLCMRGHIVQAFQQYPQETPA